MTIIMMILTTTYKDDVMMVIIIIMIIIIIPNNAPLIRGTASHPFVSYKKESTHFTPFKW